ncbi:MAG: hypothetical protein QM763_18955 [Agriterribacter sp.]
MAIVKGHDFDMFLREKMRKESIQDGTWSRQVFYPNGILALQIGGWDGREYKDGSLKLEEQLAKIIAGLELSAEQATQQQLEFEKATAERKERERLAKELEDRKQQDLINFKKLLTDSERWHKAENLRSYIQELEARAVMKDQSISPETLQWIEWAKKRQTGMTPSSKIQMSF